MRRKPGTDTKFPAQFAGNWLSVPGFVPRVMLPVRLAPKTANHSTGGRIMIATDSKVATVSFYINGAWGTPRGRTMGTVTNPDRKSTRLNSSHLGISYAVFCLKK